MPSGKAAARPVKPWVILLGSNGTPDRWPPCLISVATDTTSSTSSSKAKKKPASLVDTATPRNIITMAPAGKTAEKTLHGMLGPVYTWLLLALTPPHIPRTD